MRSPSLAPVTSFQRKAFTFILQKSKWVIIGNEVCMRRVPLFCCFREIYGVDCNTLLRFLLLWQLSISNMRKLT